MELSFALSQTDSYKLKSLIYDFLNQSNLIFLSSRTLHISLKYQVLRYNMFSKIIIKKENL